VTDTHASKTPILLGRLELIGRLLCTVLGLGPMAAGVAMSITVVTAPLGIALAAFGFLLIARALFQQHSGTTLRAGPQRRARSGEMRGKTLVDPDRQHARRPGRAPTAVRHGSTRRPPRLYADVIAPESGR